jgi:hypothetical protein
MEMRFAGNHCAGCTKLLHEPGIARSIAVEIAIEMHSATGGCAAQIKAVFHGDRQAPERGTAIVKRATGAVWHGCCAIRFGAGPGCVLPQIGVAAGIPVGARKSLIR